MFEERAVLHERLGTRAREKGLPQVAGHLLERSRKAKECSAVIRAWLLKEMAAAMEPLPDAEAECGNVAQASLRAGAT